MVVVMAWLGGGDGRARTGRGALLPLVAVLTLLVLAGCSSSSGSAKPSAARSTAKNPTVRIAGTAPVSYLTPVRLAVTDGSFSSVQVSSVEDNVATGPRGSRRPRPSPRRRTARLRR